jgi:cytochrome c553
MNELSKDFTDDDWRLFVEEIAKFPPPIPPTEGTAPSRLESGRTTAQSQRCSFYHNPDMSGHNRIGRIGAQREDYLIRTLREYKSGERREYGPAIVEVAQSISDEETVEIAHYLTYRR